MPSTLNNVKIRLRTDEISNWTAVNPILKHGEIAIVTGLEEGENLKIGNGLSSFEQLPYLFQNRIKTENVTAKNITAKSISQGYNVKSTPTSFATGIFTQAHGNFNVVHGIEAKALSDDNYAFVFNGQNLPFDGQNFYTSHGEGSFNINPVGGLSGFYIGEQTLCSVLDDLAHGISGYVDNSLSGRLLSSDLSFSYDSSDKYIRLKAFGGEIGNVNCTDFIKDGMLSSVQLCGNILVFSFNTDAGTEPISVSLSSFRDNYDEKIKALSDDISALSTKVDIIGEDYLDSNDKLEIYNDLLSPDEVKLYKGPGNKDISLSVGTGTQLCVYTATLSDFYLTSETSSANEISSKFDEVSQIQAATVSQMAVVASQMATVASQMIQNDALISAKVDRDIENLTKEIYDQRYSKHIEADIQSIGNIITVINNANAVLSIETMLLSTSGFEDICDGLCAIYRKLDVQCPALSNYDMIFTSLNGILNSQQVLSTAYTIKHAILDLRDGYSKKSYVDEQIQYVMEQYAVCLSDATLILSNDIRITNGRVDDLSSTVLNDYSTKEYLRTYVEQHSSTTTIRTWTAS